MATDGMYTAFAAMILLVCAILIGHMLGMIDFSRGNYFGTTSEIMMPYNTNCPDIMVQRAGMYELYDSRDLNRPPLVFTDMDQYYMYLKRQRLHGKPCPRVSIRQEYDIHGGVVFREDLPHTRGIPNMPSGHVDYINRDPSQRIFQSDSFLPDTNSQYNVLPAPNEFQQFAKIHRFAKPEAPAVSESPALELPALEKTEPAKQEKEEEPGEQWFKKMLLRFAPSTSIQKPAEEKKEGEETVVVTAPMELTEKVDVPNKII